MLNWKPDYDLRTDLDGNTNIVIKSSEKDLHLKVSEAIAHIKDKKEVVSMLETIISSVSYYISRRVIIHKIIFLFDI